MNNPFDPYQPLNETTFVIFDVETTGLSPTYGHRVCELACLRVRDGVTLGRFESLIDPRRPISPGAFRVNHITPEMLRGAPTFAGIAAPLLQVMDGTVLVAHNAPFDLGFLAAELEIARLPLPENPVIDTLTLTRRVFGFARNSLSAVAAALGLDNGPTHRAMGDVQTTLGVLEHILCDLKRRRGITTLDQLIVFQGGSIPYPNVRSLPLPPTITDDAGGGANFAGTRRSVRWLSSAQRGSQTALPTSAVANM
jgi:DNA polymerase III epsilon subunit family exonuclease